MTTVTVDEWVKKSEKRMLAVFRESTQRMVSLMQSRIPVDTGFARASIRASLQAMPLIDQNASRPKEGTFVYNPLTVLSVIANAKIGDQIYIGWMANYVFELERGHSQQAPSGFIRVSSLEWPQIVTQVVSEAKARAQ